MADFEDEMSLLPGADNTSALGNGTGEFGDNGSGNNGAWGSVSYASSDQEEFMKSMANLSTEEYLKVMLGPKQVTKTRFLNLAHLTSGCAKRINFVIQTGNWSRVAHA